MSDLGDSSVFTKRLNEAQAEIAGLKAQLGRANECYAARTKEADEMAAKIASLRAQLADNILEKDNNRLKSENIKLRAQIASARKALERLACRHVKGTPLWWQREAREAVSSLTDDLQKGE